MRRKILILCTAGLVAAVLWVSCSQPQPFESISWLAKYSLPLLNETLRLGELLTQSLGGGTQFEEDSLRIGDTLHVVVRDTSLERSQRIIAVAEDASASFVAGKFKLTNLPPLRYAFDLSGLGLPGIPLPFSVPVGIVDSMDVPAVESVTFDSSSADGRFLLINRSQQVTLANMQGALWCNGTVLCDLGAPSTVGPGETLAVAVPLAGKTITGKIHASFAFDVAAGSILDATSGMEAVFHMEGLELESARLVDSLVAFSLAQSDSLPVGEKEFRLNYFDLAQMGMVLHVWNGTPLQLSVTPRFHHFWKQSYCRQLGLILLDSAGVLDSAQFKGGQISGMTVGGAQGAVSGYNAIALAFQDLRVFPVWDSMLEWSTMPFEVVGAIQPTGQVITITAGMGISLQTTGSYVRFSSIAGEYGKNKFTAGKMEYAPVYPAGFADVYRELEGKFRFERTETSIAMEFKIPDSTRLSRVEYACRIYDKKDFQPIDTIYWTMEGIQKDSTYQFDFELDRVVNLFPESLAYAIDYTFPANTPIAFEDSVIQEFGDTSKIILDIESVLDFKLYLAWNVEDTIRLGLGTSKMRFPMGAHQLRSIEDRLISIHYTLGNNTNLKGSLFALGSSEAYRMELENLSRMNMGPGAMGSPEARNLVAILGREGILLPGRGSETANTVFLTPAEGDSLLLTDSLFIRWELVLDPVGNAALFDTDFLSLDAMLSVDGVQSTDGLW